MPLVASFAAALAAFVQVAAAPAALTPGTITLALTKDGADAPPERDTYLDEVQRALSEAGFLPLPSVGHSRYVATVSVTQRMRGAVTADGEEAGPTTRVGNWGAAMGVTLPSHKTGLRGLAITEMTLAIALRDNGQVVWRGTALTAQAQGTRSGTTAAVARKLADALAHRFPEDAREPIAVP